MRGPEDRRHPSAQGPGRYVRRRLVNEMVPSRVQGRSHHGGRHPPRWPGDTGRTAAASSLMRSLTTAVLFPRYATQGAAIGNIGIFAIAVAAMSLSNCPLIFTLERSKGGGYGSVALRFLLVLLVVHLPPGCNDRPMTPLLSLPLQAAMRGGAHAASGASHPHQALHRIAQSTSRKYRSASFSQMAVACYL